jgi:hypothetical protein
MEKHDQILFCQKDNSNDLQKFPKFESANRLALDHILNRYQTSAKLGRSHIFRTSRPTPNHPPKRFEKFKFKFR